MGKRAFLAVTISVFILVILYSFSGSAQIATTTGATTLSTTETSVVAPLAAVMVTNTADSGAGSLRDAINTSNQTAGTTIQFNIPNTDPGFNGRVFVIKVATALPTLNKDTTVIDGTTQTAATGDTNPGGPEIVIDGGVAASGIDGITISSNSNTIRGLNIRSFSTGAGILIKDASKSNTIAGCYIGTDETGTATAPNQTGVRIIGGADMNTIGGSTAAGANVISGNLADGVVITGTSTDGNSVIGNFIGVDATTNRNQLPNFGNGVVISGGAKANVIGGATASLANVIAGNFGNGILITGSATSGNLVQGNFIGMLANGAVRSNGQSGISLMDGTDTNTIGGVGAGNTIAFNLGNGITVGSSAGATAVVKNKITRNSIFSNGGLGIDLGNDGVTNNDAGDTDNGPNNLLNFPVLTSAMASGGNITVTGTIDTPVPNTITIEFFTNALPSPGVDPSGFGEGQTFATTAVPNASGAFTATFPGSANVAITATATDASGNTSEFSLAFVLGAGQPDLIVTGLTVTPTSVNTGGTVKVQFTIKNQGTSSASAARNDVVLSTDSTIDNQDMVLTSVTTAALGPNMMQTPPFSVNVTIPAGTSGQVFIGVIADAGNAVTESNEANNTASTQLNVISMPDLTVTNLSVNPVSASPGDTVRVQFSVVNQGSSNAGSHVEEIRLSTDNVITTDDTLLGSVTSSGIAAGSTTQFAIDVRIPSNTAPGTYFVGVIADARNAIAETNETNNTASASITVSGNIDFDLANLTAKPNSGPPGTQVALNFQLINRGTLPAPATTLEVRFSTDNTINSSDTLLGSFMSSPLGPGETATLNFNATIPTGIASGRFFIGVIADALGQVSESNENNNTISVAFTVADQNPPRVIVQSPNGNEVVISGETFTIKWTSTDDVGVVTQDIFLSTDGGANFNQVIVTGLSGTANSFLWTVPVNLNTTAARVQVVARDAVGNLGNDASDNNFTIAPRPIIINPVFNNGKLKFLVTGSNIMPGATLIVVNGTSRESFATALNSEGTKFIVKKNTTSTPSGLTLRQAIPAGVAVQLIVRNPNGVESTPLAFQRQ